MSNTIVSTSTHPLQQIEDDRFTVACRQAAEIMFRPEFNGRLDKAMDFVLDGHVALHEDGTATVKSGSHTYHLEPDCTCQDSRQRSKYCKHYLAVELLRRTYERLGVPCNSNGHHTLETQPNTPQSAVWDCHQAPSSCTLKWAFNGIEMLLTLRDATDEALFSRIQRVMPKIEEKMDLQRQKRQERQQAQNNNGNNGSNDDNASATTEEPPYCKFHDVPLKQHTKDGRSWHSHFDIDTQSWCYGR